MKKIPFLILLISIVSFTSKSNSQFILGSWFAQYPKVDFSKRFDFIDNNTLIVNLKENADTKTDTLSYKLVDNEERLVTKEKISGTQEFDIARLSADTLILIKGNDILNFKKIN